MGWRLYLETLSIGELPSHKHTGLDIDGVYIFGWDNGSLAGFDFLKNTTHGDKTANRITTGNTGSNLKHNNLSPYLTVFIWCRIL